MEDPHSPYREMYAVLLRAVINALRELKACNYGLAATVLKSAQHDAEDVFLAYENDQFEEFMASLPAMEPLERDISGATAPKKKK